MNFTAMAHPLFFLLVLSIFPTASGTAASLSSPYCPTYDCGNGVQIRYPFWRLDNTTSTQFCGYRDFGLTCSDSGEPILSLPGDSYYVKNINYKEYTLTLVDIDILDQPCPRARHNLTITATLPLYYSSLDLNLTFYFNCTSTSSVLQHIQCLASYPRKSYVFIVGEETDNFDWLANCEEKVVATVMEEEISIANLSGGFGGAMKKGFILDWRSVRDCGECEAHDGLCGYNNAQGEGLCFCKDGSISRDNCKERLMRRLPSQSITSSGD
ncbi:LEAF RUST 10 DISEASE-RESISTANCE LOCUS RECEPTOR-LIKE PROTEIN KINASE-like 1.2 [Vitis riparia]|uniref:LEAF RUST 10 DISEASE-RESISTANCE LOCUS RECEPTOR-LIKE PROTEIN KINASE-like 1.2 n=1 Tax=Vitis riparia TaxID=96939 RepID=UPI00155AD0BA|nr:LEAF RUST 10 DISEASE-RESISTANCE LOCUS RECEPTOR-LIKE PROTEIN KINASE-like 1.2 [Vitis riparia]